jgi:hypothetical protein
MFGGPGEIDVGIAGWRLAAGDPRAAARSFEQALARIPPSATALHARAEAGLARAYVAMNESARALPMLERALPALVAEPTVRPGTLAEARFATAQALVAMHGDAKRAHALAEQARDAFAALTGKLEARRRAAVEAWLASHR